MAIRFFLNVILGCDPIGVMGSFLESYGKMRTLQQFTHSSFRQVGKHLVTHNFNVFGHIEVISTM